ncbi:LacI family DNA-binding transcriptional regulator [Cellulosimicrobium protaetiae]|uniref:LacI family DNA-binding transcriptional regulator n=1 Tax=Cellulosimicrobium protaetiae TaxID=2587808 RepID=A0A6M5UKC1_9MICO|nr:LacI family DNA-binding transcriptional regulator [Cellulosimicrobium protaetiae]QJW37783.1 LacI family DNA-binding transcriptional regulator [Cellulosimicrobium protaetiae]
MPGPTLSEVARDAGVSLATASRAINGSANRTVRPDLRERVLASARRLGYSPDPSAQAMARGRTTSVGLVVHDIADPYFSSLAAGVAEAADRDGLIVTLTSTRHSPKRERAFVELMDRQRARAVVLGGGRLAEDADGALRGALERYRASGGGVSLVGQPLGDLPAVEIANADGAADLARALHGLGYRAFGVLAGPAGHRTALDRARGFTEALADLGSPVPPDAVVECAFTRDGGHGGMRDLLDRLGSGSLGTGTPPVAVFAVNDVMAVGAMAAAREAGLRVPEDVAVAGFDDIVTLRDVTPGLTTVRIPLAEVGEQALALALAAPDDDAEPRRVEVRGEVVLRESTPRL